MTTPGQVLDLSGWKLTLPVGSPGKPTEVTHPALATYEHPDYFAALDSGVRFRAPVNGVTTSGSANPRSELREMTPGGGLASWSSSTGAHALTVDAAVTRLPNARTDGGNAAVVVAQIHDADDDVTVFRCEGGKLWVTKGDDTHYRLADGGYVLGTPFKAHLVVWRDEVRAYYNGRLVTTIPGKFSGCYFKAGCYTQANSGNSRPTDASNYGEAVVYSLLVTHAVEPLAEPVEPPSTTPQETPVPDGPSRAEHDALVARVTLLERARPPVSSPTPVPGTYRVQPGDTLQGIASRLGLTPGWRKLYHANLAVVGPDPAKIRPGMVLIVPPEQPWTPPPAIPPGTDIPPPGGEKPGIGTPLSTDGATRTFTDLVAANRYLTSEAKPGDRVALAGDWGSATKIEVRRSGTAEAPIVILGGGTLVCGGVSVKASHVHVDGLVTRHPAAPGAFLQGNHITLSNTLIDGPRDGDGDCIRAFGDDITIAHNHGRNTDNSHGHADFFQTFSAHGSSSRLKLLYNVAENIANIGIIGEGPGDPGDGSGKGESKGWLIKGNYIENSSANGIYIEAVQGVTIEDNEFAGDITMAIGLEHGSTGATVRNNRCDKARAKGLRYEVGIDASSRSGYTGPEPGGGP